MGEINFDYFNMIPDLLQNNLHYLTDKKGILPIAVLNLHSGHS